MDIKQGFARALRQLRKHKGLPQESFSDLSSRTYVSSLERGLYTPTIEKVENLADVIGVHPLTLLTKAYLESNKKLSLESLQDKVKREIEALEE